MINTAAIQFPELRMTEVEPLTGQCGLHEEFVRRIDDRWRDHLAGHASNREELCEKIERLDTRLERLRDSVGKLEVKINWLIGGAAVGIPALQLIMHLLFNKGNVP